MRLSPDLVIITEEVFTRKLHFLYSDLHLCLGGLLEKKE